MVTFYSSNRKQIHQAILLTLPSQCPSLQLPCLHVLTPQVATAAGDLLTPSMVCHPGVETHPWVNPDCFFLVHIFEALLTIVTLLNFTTP